MIQKCIIQGEMAKKNSAADGGFAAVSSQFQNKNLFLPRQINGDINCLYAVIIFMTLPCI